MLKAYHIEICSQALSEHFGPQALEVIISANIRQDALRGQIGHPEYHFDDSAFDEGYAYLEAQRQIIQQILFNDGNLLYAWKAFGRLTHAAQDFYAHSNYLRLWQTTFPDGELPQPAEVPAIDDSLLSHPDLRSGRIYPGEFLMYIFPPLADWFKQRLPRDAHAWMNLDFPEQGPLFPYAIAAAKKRTLHEYELLAGQITQTLGEETWSRFSSL